MKFTKKFKAGFEIFSAQKMTQPKKLDVSKATIRKLYVAEAGTSITA